MGLSTKDLVTSGGGGLPKTISPGNVTLKINKLELEDFSFIEGAKHLLLHVETEPIDGFEGFLFDKDNEGLGRHAGQVGKVLTVVQKEGPLDNQIVNKITFKIN